MVSVEAGNDLGIDPYPPKARLVKLPDRVTTIVIGNPLIADVTLQAGGLMVITGKGYGTTNLIALDRSGAVLFERNILVVPDVICNAGGVTVSYFEWVQDFSSFFWSEDEINVRLDKIMVDALKKIWDTADRHKITLRTATFAVACERILIAREERGLYP